MISYVFQDPTSEKIDVRLISEGTLFVFEIMPCNSLGWQDMALLMFLIIDKVGVHIGAP